MPSKLNKILAPRLDQLVTAFGPSGHEDLFIQPLIKNMISGFVDSTCTDRNGNLYAIINGNPKLPRVMFNAHSDSVGFIVKFIDDLGFIFTSDFANALDRRTLPGKAVTIYSSRKKQFVKGNYTTKSVHLLDEEELSLPEDHLEIAIDIGAKGFDHAKQYVSIGDVGVFYSPPQYLLNDERIVSSALDDRVGVLSLIRVAEKIKKSNLEEKCTAIFAFTTNEETTTDETSVAVQRYDPDVGIVVDITIATDYIRENNEDTIAKKYGQLALDEGVCIAKGVGVDRRFVEMIEETARKRKIDYQIEPDPNSSGTENKKMRVSGKGVITSLLSIPMRSSHSPVETASLRDIESTSELAYQTYKELSRGALRERFSD